MAAAGGRNYKLGDPETGLLTDEQKEIIVRCAGLGSSMVQIGYILGVDKSTWLAYRKRHEGELDDLFEKGKAQAEFQVSNALFKNATRGELGSIMWYEKTRAGRREVVEQQIDQTTQYVIAAPPEMTLEEWQEKFTPKQDVPRIENPTPETD